MWHAGNTSEGILTLGVLDLGKAAKILSEIGAVTSDADLQGLQVISKEAGFLSLARADVQKQAQVSVRICPSNLTSVNSLASHGQTKISKLLCGHHTWSVV